MHLQWTNWRPLQGWVSCMGDSPQNLVWVPSFESAPPPPPLQVGTAPGTRFAPLLDECDSFGVALHVEKKHTDCKASDVRK